MDILRNVPLGIYLESPRTWLHQLDPRLKLIWLLSIILSPILATNTWRLTVVGALVVLTVVGGLPRRVWIRQLPLLLGVGLISFSLTALAPDGLGVTPIPLRQSDSVSAYGLVATDSLSPGSAISSERLAPSAEILSRTWDALPAPSGYRYQLGSLELLGRDYAVNRRTLALGIRIGTLIFTLFYSTNLFLVTTAPEEITEGVERLIRPLHHLKVPTPEIILTLTLALRFVPLVLEEVQNLIRSVRTRDIRWQTLGLRGTINVGLALVERFLENVFYRAEQTAAAMQARGYLSPRISVRWHVFQLQWLDWILIASLPVFWSVRILYFSDVG